MRGPFLVGPHRCEHPVGYPAAKQSQGLGARLFGGDGRILVVGLFGAGLKLGHCGNMQRGADLPVVPARQPGEPLGQTIRGSGSYRSDLLMSPMSRTRLPPAVSPMIGASPATRGLGPQASCDDSPHHPGQAALYLDHPSGERPDVLLDVADDLRLTRSGWPGGNLGRPTVVPTPSSRGYLRRRVTLAEDPAN